MNHFDGKHKLSLNFCLKWPILFELWKITYNISLTLKLCMATQAG